MTPKHKRQVGQALKAARKQKGITMRQLADEMGLGNHTYIAQIERGEFKDGTTPKRYCEALGAKFSERYYFSIHIYK